jgi:copper(I)-binding protein
MERVLKGFATIGLLAVAGCGEGPRPNDDLGTLGDNGRSGQVQVLNVHLQPPADDRYTAGDDVVVRFTMVNNGDEVDRLTGVSAADAREAVLHWDAGCDGTAEPVSDIPLPGGTTGFDVGPPEERRHKPYYVTLRDITELTIAGTTTDMTFTFAEAGEITVDAMVAIDRPRPTTFEYACDVRP